MKERTRYRNESNIKHCKRLEVLNFADELDSLLEEKQYIPEMYIKKYKEVLLDLIIEAYYERK